MSDFLSLEALGALAGAACVVTGLTQALKRIVAADPKVIACWLAGFISLMAQIASGDFSAAGFGMAALNAVILAAASVGAFETVVKPCQKYLEGDAK